MTTTTSTTTTSSSTTLMNILATFHRFGWWNAKQNPVPNRRRLAFFGSSTRSLDFANDSGSRRTLLTRHSSSSSSCSSSRDNDIAAARGSRRGRAAVDLLPVYLADARAVEKYHAVSCPHGALQLGVAESQLLQDDWLVPALNNNNMDNLVVPADAIYYQPTSGRDDLKRAMAHYIEGLCHLNANPSEKRKSLQLDGLILGAGCNAVLENLVISLADAGETVLLPTPYYAAFAFDLGARANLRIQPVTTEAYNTNTNNNNDATTHATHDKNHLLDPRRYYPNRRALDAAYDRTLEATGGMPPKILLVSHPMNPLGICYPPEIILECMAWCRERRVHFISDEIYAGSVYHPNTHNNRFVSALELASRCSSSSSSSSDNTKEGDDAESSASLSLGPFVHWVYALSKDWAVSGLRVGVAYSENESIRGPLQKLNDLCQISSQTQLWTTHMLNAQIPSTTVASNEQGGGGQSPPTTSLVYWRDEFQRVNHERLRERSSALTKLLDDYKIPYLQPEAGLFVWMDLSQFLPSNNDNSNTLTPDQQERTLYLEIIQKFGILMTPGTSMHNEQPGFFRCVFTAASSDEFALALRRLEAFFRAKLLN